MWLNSLFTLTIEFYWSIVGLQSSVSFPGIQQSDYIYVYSFSDSFLLHVITKYWI